LKQFTKQFRNVLTIFIRVSSTVGLANIQPIGMCCLHVDDLFITGTPEFLEKFKKVVKSQVKIGHEDVNDLMFTGQRVKWIIDEKTKK
jgi:hypothetical protein